MGDWGEYQAERKRRRHVADLEADKAEAPEQWESEDILLYLRGEGPSPLDENEYLVVMDAGLFDQVEEALAVAPAVKDIETLAGLYDLDAEAVEIIWNKTHPMVRVPENQISENQIPENQIPVAGITALAQRATTRGFVVFEVLLIAVGLGVLGLAALL